jgi:hypothetical protein
MMLSTGAESEIAALDRERKPLLKLYETVPDQAASFSAYSFLLIRRLSITSPGLGVGRNINYLLWRCSRRYWQRT